VREASKAIAPAPPKHDDDVPQNVIPHESIDEAEAVMTPAQRAPMTECDKRFKEPLGQCIDSDDGSNTDRFEEALREAVDRQMDDQRTWKAEHQSVEHMQVRSRWWA
jgi:hypothetical protein